MRWTRRPAPAKATRNAHHRDTPGRHHRHGRDQPAGRGRPRAVARPARGTQRDRPAAPPRQRHAAREIAAQVPESFDPATGIDERTLPLLDRTSEFALHAAREAIAHSGIDFTRDGLGQRTAVIVGTGVGGETTQDEQSRRIYAEKASRTHPLTIVRLMTNASASQISIAYGLRGPTYAVASACASANHAIIQAAQMI